MTLLDAKEGQLFQATYLALTYSLKRGRYNFTLECKNLTDERLYDNFSLQKAGRAFYGKVRIYFGG